MYLCRGREWVGSGRFCRPEFGGPRGGGGRAAGGHAPAAALAASGMMNQQLIQGEGVGAGSVLVVVIVVVRLDGLVAVLAENWPEPTNVDRRADANSSWLRLIYGSIEGHAPRGVLSTGAGEAQDGCKL